LGVLFPEKVAEVRNGILGVPDERVLRLLAVVLFAVDVRKDRGNLAICKRYFGQ